MLKPVDFRETQEQRKARLSVRAYWFGKYRDSVLNSEQTEPEPEVVSAVPEPPKPRTCADCDEVVSGRWLRCRKHSHEHLLLLERVRQRAAYREKRPKKTLVVRKNVLQNTVSQITIADVGRLATDQL